MLFSLAIFRTYCHYWRKTQKFTVVVEKQLSFSSELFLVCYILSIEYYVIGQEEKSCTPEGS